jgi:hypothetical protein
VETPKNNVTKETIMNDNGTGTSVRTDVMAVTNSEGVGAMVWWELQGGVSMADLRAAWGRNGLDCSLIPTENPTRRALRRALDELPAKAHLVRPLANKQGFSLVAESGEGEALSYQQEVTVVLQDDQTLRITGAQPTLDDMIRANYVHALATFSSIEVSSILLRLVDTLSSVTLRDRGGFYFLPPASIATFRKAAQAFKEVSGCVCYEVPAMRSDEAVAAILAAVEKEALTEGQSLEQVLSDTEASARTLSTKSKAVARIEAKVASYETLLGAKLTDVQNALAALRAKLVEASFRAFQEEQA